MIYILEELKTQLVVLLSKTNLNLKSTLSEFRSALLEYFGVEYTEDTIEDAILLVEADQLTKVPSFFVYPDDYYEGY
jgi:hypothetical protein